MKTVDEILRTIDNLNKESRLEEAEKYMLDELKVSKAEGAWNISLTILNELAGHYRDRGIMKKALDSCLEAEKIMDSNDVGKTKERAAAYLNTANVYRAMGELDDSFSYYKKALTIIEICGDPSLYSSYYNNLALLHQEAGKFDEAVDCLKKALIIADEKMGDELRVAISRTNLATSLIRAKRLGEAYDYLKPAVDLFAGRTPSDFHYSAALSAMGDLSLLRGELDKAADYFETALSEIDMHMGQNRFYTIVKDNLDRVYELKGGRPDLSGLELCEKYFELFAKPVLKKNFSEIEEHIACGMFGEGSECLGFDDAISRDHDFGPSFLIVVDDNVTDKDRERLEKMYDNLPKMFMGLRRLETLEGKGRVGVVTIKDLLRKTTGFDHVPKGAEEWRFTVDENLLLITNGKVFMDKSGWFTDIRRHINNDQPYFVYFNKLAIQLELMAKHGQYGYKRAHDRADAVAMLNAKAEFIKATLRTCHLLMKRYAPYDKWLSKSLKDLIDKKVGMSQHFKAIVDSLENLALRGINIDKVENKKDIELNEDIADIEQICQKISEILISSGICQTKEDYLLTKAYELKALATKTVLADKIVDIEWHLFDKTQNEGGRANCQDDWGTFSIMRRSQYYTWPVELLNMLYVDFSEAISNGRNVISEKYGFMMESTAPEEFAKIKGKLTEISEDKRKIINAIVEIQVGFMEKFACEYPGLADNARVIHSSEDNRFVTSYETYLRGELSTYHNDTLNLYGRFIAELASNNKNLAYMIMNMTTFFYGYASLKDAVDKQN